MASYGTNILGLPRGESDGQKRIRIKIFPFFLKVRNELLDEKSKEDNETAFNQLRKEVNDARKAVDFDFFYRKPAAGMLIEGKQTMKTDRSKKAGKVLMDNLFEMHPTPKVEQEMSKYFPGEDAHIIGSSLKDVMDGKDVMGEMSGGFKRRNKTRHTSKRGGRKHRTRNRKLKRNLTKKRGGAASEGSYVPDGARMALGTGILVNKRQTLARRLDEEVAEARGKERAVLIERNKLLKVIGDAEMGKRGSIQALQKAVDHAEDIIGDKEGYDWRPTAAQENAALSRVDTREWKERLVDYLLGGKKGKSLKDTVKLGKCLLVYLHHSSDAHNFNWETCR